MDFASSYVNMAYDSEEDDLELSDTEMENGLIGGLDFDEAQDDMLAPPPPGAAPAPAGGGGPPRAGFFANLRDRFGSRNEEDEAVEIAAPAAAVPLPLGIGVPPAPPPEFLLEQRNKRQQKQALKKKKKPAGKKRRRQRMNTNVVSMKLGTLASDADHLQTVAPYFCNNKGCRCVLNSNSELVDVLKLREKAGEGEESLHGDIDVGKDQKLWICEFCGEKNVIVHLEGEVPQGESQDYILEPPPDVDQQVVGEDSQVVIFCVDVSGSMCVTKEVKGKFKLKGDKAATTQSLNAEGYDQFMPGQNRQTTWVSRLQAVQAAVNNEIERLAEISPNYRIGLVTFSREVTIYGDGTSDQVTIKGDKLNNLEQLQATGARYIFDKPIKESKGALCQTLFELEEGGPTALGPALAVCIAMASKQNGSKVVICTDGLANVGLGSLDIDMDSDERATEVENWYEEMGNYGAISGVSVSVISITDDQCRLENLGKVCDLTNGTVDQIDPLELMNNFAGILENPVVATNVNATMFVHRGLRLRREDDDIVDDEEVKQEEGVNDFIVDRISRDIGNVTDDSQIFFEYSVKKDELPLWKEMKALPFQVQIKYMKMDKSQCIRVITQLKPITFEQEKAEKEVNVRVMSSRAAQHSARLAEKGDYEGSRAVNYGNALFLDRVCELPEQQMELQGHIKEAAVWDNVIHEEQQSEVMENRSVTSFGKMAKKKNRSRNRRDHVSKAMYKMKKKNY